MSLENAIPNPIGIEASYRMIIVAFNQAELQSLAGLIVAGAKSANTGAEAIIQAAALLAKLQAAVVETTNKNGHAPEVADQPAA